ncbi:hypothetical protein [Mycobacterium sp.]|uniref:hypothetical protein n=1 Tax=Mycobacterium sp. TaxID=1785 RepID=UPI003C7788E6
MPALDPRDRVQRFVLRARRVLAHSLVRNHLDLLSKTAQGTFTVHVEWNQGTGEGKHRLQMKLPPEEQFESFAARLRPFVMRKESVYWAAVLDALEKLLSKETLADLVDMQTLRDYWSEVVEGSQVAAQAYYVMTNSGQLSDVQLADLWLNSDALHTQPIQSAIGKDVSLSERYKAAAGVYSRIGACLQYTYIFIDHLVSEGLLELDRSAFTQQVVADCEIDEPTQAYCVPLGGAPMPTDLSELDLNKWKPVHEDPALGAVVQGKIKAAEEGTPKAS